jgi:hypothetical protein
VRYASAAAFRTASESFSSAVGSSAAIAPEAYYLKVYGSSCRNG